MKIIGVIPARWGSTRLPEKVLREMDGRPMIYHVWSRVRQAAKLEQVLIATDDDRVQKAAEDFGAKCVMTRPDHPSGSLRIAEVAGRFKADVFINIQGDEPLIHPANVDGVAAAFQDSSVRVATLAVRKNDRDEYLNPNTVKVVCAPSGDALYFSRAPIPHFRDGTFQKFYFLKHLGIYGYRSEVLDQMPQWPSSALEETEKLEQLRILDQGIPIRVIETVYDSFGVDTEDDLKKAEAQIIKLRGGG